MRATRGEKQGKYEEFDITGRVVQSIMLLSQLGIDKSIEEFQDNHVPPGACILIHMLAESFLGDSGGRSEDAGYHRKLWIEGMKKAAYPSS